MSRNQKVLIVDDEQGVHDASRLVLRKLRFNGKPVQLVHAFSAEEGRKVFSSVPDIAVALVDVVMEHEQAGLDLVRYVRGQLYNNTCRIILRTAHPGSAPEVEVVRHLEIDDYKEKTELTADRLYTTVYTALRAYQNLEALNRTNRGLNQVIEAFDSIFRGSSTLDILQRALAQLPRLVAPEIDPAVLQRALIARTSEGRIVLMTGASIDENTGDLVEPVLPPAVADTVLANEVPPPVLLLAEGLALIIDAGMQERYLIWVPLPAPISVDAVTLVRMFAEKLSLGVRNAALRQNVLFAQQDMLSRLCEVIENRSNETGKHVKRMARYSRLFAELLGLPAEQVEILTAAAPLHDIGKIATPDAVLQKPGKLTDEEFRVMREHAEVGYRMLAGSSFSIVQAGAEIARSHHEKWNGGGYPRGIAGEDIPIFARIVALADVFDALTSTRVYKPAFSIEQTMQIVTQEAGRHFDPQLAALLHEYLPSFLDIKEELAD